MADVCLARLQFSCWNRNDPGFMRVMRMGIAEPSEVRARAAAALVLLGEAEDPTGGADHYFTTLPPPGVALWPPAWYAGMERKGVIGAHSFAKERV